MVEKFINFDPDSCKEFLFAIFDLNNDKQLCETDMFNVMKLMQTIEMQAIFIDDIQKVLKKLEFMRKKLGRNDEIKIKQDDLNLLLKNAVETNKIVTRKK